jgi:hypothetical protein
MNVHSLLVSAMQLHERWRGLFAYKRDGDDLRANRAAQAACAAASRKARGDGRLALRAWGLRIALSIAFIFRCVFAFDHL